MKPEDVRKLHAEEVARVLADVQTQREFQKVRRQRLTFLREAEALLAKSESTRQLHAEARLKADDYERVIASVDAELVAVEAQSARHALMGTRTRVHEALQAEFDAPEPEADEDPEDHHGRQRAHGRRLWKLADEIVAGALK